MTGISEKTERTYTVTNDQGRAVATIRDDYSGQFEVLLDCRLTFDLAEVERLALALSHATATFLRGVHAAQAEFGTNGHGR